jgi:hypothetical protein
MRPIPTPAHDPQANPRAHLFPPFHRAVTHNHHRDDIWSLYADADQHFTYLEAEPERALRHIGSPFAIRTGIAYPAGWPGRFPAGPLRSRDTNAQAQHILGDSRFPARACRRGDARLSARPAPSTGRISFL